MLIAPDVSEFQSAQANDSFNRRWLIFRGCDGQHLDAKAIGNADWCRGALAEGRIVGWSVYVVYRPGMNAAVLNNVAKLGPVPRFEVDIESWANTASPIHGDHSDEINSLIQDFTAIVGPQMVWRYGNQGDLASIHPRPLAGQLTRVASYTPTRPNLPNLIGWQYTNGTENHTANPSSSPPFNACDHNELYVDELPPSGGGIPIGGFSVTDSENIAEILAIVQNGVPGSFLANMNTHIDTAAGNVVAAVTSALAPELTELTTIEGQLVDFTPGGSVDLTPVLDAINALPAAVVAAIKEAL